MNKKSKASLILAAVSLIISIFLLVGINFIFPACGLHDDGSYASCHWAGQAVLAAAIMLTAMSLAALILPAKQCMGCSICLAVCAVVTAIIPDTFIKLCMMPTMKCQASMKPWVIICSVVIAVIAVINIVINAKGNGQDAK